MKILHVTRDLPPRANGGISTAVGGMLAALSERGVECAVLSFDGYRPKRRDPAPGPPRADDLHGAAVLRVTHPAQLPAAERWARAFGADLSHCHHDLLWEAATAIGARKHVLTAHVLQRAQNRLRGLTTETMSSRAQDRAVREADRVLAPSHSAARMLREDYELRTIAAVPLGVSEHPLSPRHRDHVVYLGRFSDIRGLGDLLDAIPDIAAARPTTQLAIVGGAPDNPRAEKRWMERIAEVGQRAGLSIATPGWLPPEEAWVWLERAHIAVVPSWIETFGMAAAEAMLAGAAVVASDLGSLRELIDAETGVLVPPRQPEALATAIVELMDDDAMRHALGANARRSILANWTWSRRIEPLVDAYREVLS